MRAMVSASLEDGAKGMSVDWLQQTLEETVLRVPSLVEQLRVAKVEQARQSLLAEVRDTLVRFEAANETSPTLWLDKVTPAPCTCA